MLRGVSPVSSFDKTQQPKFSNSKSIKLDENIELTPQLAAKLVKYYVIPMFKTKKNDDLLAGDLKLTV